MKTTVTTAFALLMSLSLNSWSYSQPCQLVAQMAGNKEYQAQPLRMASMQRPSKMNSEWNLQLVENHGAWHVYQMPESWMDKKSCAPITKTHLGQNIEFVPVVLNKRTGHNAVVTGTYVIKTYRKRDFDKVMNRYGFIMLSPLPNPKSAIVDVKPRNSYDLLIKELDNDRDVVLALPLLSEPRPR